MGVQIHQYEIKTNREQRLGVEIEIKVGVGVVTRSSDDDVTAEIGRKTAAQIKHKSEML
jgi:hypothetical protein